MDVIVHFTCRDANRVGMESRALQLALMGMKTSWPSPAIIPAGFAGRGAPVFDLDSVILLACWHAERADRQTGDPDVFFAGCAVSPFKSRPGRPSPSTPSSPPPRRLPARGSWSPSSDTMPASSNSWWRFSAGWD
jgi:hypothetical protein